MMADKDNAKSSVINGFVNPEIKMTGKTVLITGGNTGLGFESAKDIARRGAKVIIACRNKEKASQAKDDILKEVPEAILETTELNLGSIASISNCSKQILEKQERLDVLMNNAGLMGVPEGKTEDGFETMFGVNHLGHFLLTNQLLPLLKKSSPSRIVCLSSGAHKGGSGVMNWNDLMTEKPYKPLNAYSQSKLANILFTNALSQRLKDSGVTANSVHPGAIKTNLWNNFPDAYKNYNAVVRGIVNVGVWCTRFLKGPVQGAQTQIYCSVAPELLEVTGRYFADCKITEPTKAAQDAESAKKLWDISEKMVGLQSAE